jgi:hypothetical protein
MRTFVAILLVIALPHAARAQPGAAAPPSPPVADSEEVSPAAAFGLSLAGTAVGWGGLLMAAEVDSEALGWVAVGGILVGPSLGHFYAGEVGRGLGHTGIRLGAGAIFVVGAAITFSDCFFTEEEECDGSSGPLIMLGGAALGAGSTIYSIVDAPRAATRANQKRRRFVITPAPLVGPERSTGLGLLVGSSF